MNLTTTGAPVFHALRCVELCFSFLQRPCPRLRRGSRHSGGGSVTPSLQVRERKRDYPMGAVSPIVS